MRNKCETCVSRRLRGGVTCCSLGMDKYLENEVCGSFKEGNYDEDYNTEYNGINIDELTKMFYNGQEIKSENIGSLFTNDEVMKVMAENTWLYNEVNKLRFSISMLHGRNIKLNKLVEQLKDEK